MFRSVCEVGLLSIVIVSLTWCGLGYALHAGPAVKSPHLELPYHILLPLPEPL